MSRSRNSRRGGARKKCGCCFPKRVILTREARKAKREGRVADPEARQQAHHKAYIGCFKWW